MLTKIIYRHVFNTKAHNPSKIYREPVAEGRPLRQWSCLISSFAVQSQQHNGNTVHITIMSPEHQDISIYQPKSIVCLMACTDQRQKNNQHTPLVAPLSGEITGNQSIPHQRASNLESASMFWHHHEIYLSYNVVQEICTREWGHFSFVVLWFGTHSVLQGRETQGHRLPLCQWNNPEGYGYIYIYLLNPLTCWPRGGFDCSLESVNFKLISMINIWSIFCEIAIRWMPQHLTDHFSTLVQVMAWCRQATSHYLGQCWPRSMLPYCVTRPQWVKTDNVTTTKQSTNKKSLFTQCINSSPPGQNGRRFADDIFNCILVNENIRILIKISLRFVPKGPIDNNQHWFR